MLSEELFWQKAADYYHLDPVKQACLRLQDEHHAEVNLLLLLVWLADEHNLQPSDETIAQLVIHTETIREATHSFRLFRKQCLDTIQPAIKDAQRQQQLRSHMLNAELLLEAEVQQALIAVCKARQANHSLGSTTNRNKAEVLERTLITYCEMLDNPVSRAQLLPLLRPLIELVD